MARKPSTQKWDKMGVELEGAWDRDPLTVAQEVTGAQHHHDGSVRDLAGRMGEVTTRPHSILKNLTDDLTKLYPARVNNTCGFHIHTSFTPFNTAVLMDKDFWKFYQKRWEEWGKANDSKMGDMKNVFWSRLEGRWRRADRGNGGMNYCEAVFKPEKQMYEPHDANARYTQVNFAAWHKYKTVESRLLPMFHDVGLAVAAVEEMASIYDDYLNEAKYPKITIYKEWKNVGEQILDVTEMKMPDYKPWEFKKELPFRAPITGPDIEYSIDGANDLMTPWVREVPGNHA